METKKELEKEVEKEWKTREEMLPIEKKLVGWSIILALILLGILYWLSNALIS